MEQLGQTPKVLFFHSFPCLARLLTLSRGSSPRTHHRLLEGTHSRFLGRPRLQATVGTSSPRLFDEPSAEQAADEYDETHE